MISQNIPNLLFEYSNYIKNVSIIDLQKGWARYSRQSSKAPLGLETLLLELNKNERVLLTFEYSSYIKTISIKDLQKGWARYSN
ncbi:hypothetical protein F8M41_010548 [Gigaspora margarita]|uniref:Uncharacterized protein n=1 Tax=Gigaspora margarita TaxID=4874 RepID=A0A8H3X0L1_GIGMA|nr:hypothetical protein F8M41_010548 [Gigaspora margarita]